MDPFDSDSEATPSVALVDADTTSTDIVMARSPSSASVESTRRRRVIDDDDDDDDDGGGDGDDNNDKSGDEADSGGEPMEVDDDQTTTTTATATTAAAANSADDELFRVVTNDNQQDSMILLTGLKNIFQKQLPKMPKEYIARLVYDRKHAGLAIVRPPLRVLGGITYRVFEERGFVEIVFCAVSSTEQVKGYGSRLMNQLKDTIRTMYEGRVEHFLTYADNYAIGYFKKQGFTKEITLERSRWMGFIKDYEGGTMMQCTMVPKVCYVQVRQLLAEQKKAVRALVRARCLSSIIHPGLTQFPVDPMSIPGVKEAGWVPGMHAEPDRLLRSALNRRMQQLVHEMQAFPSAWPFLQPVNPDEVLDYYDVVTEPMDLDTMEAKVDANKYATRDQFIYDAQLVFDNCRAYNGEDTTYYKCADRLERFFYDRIKTWPADDEQEEEEGGDGGAIGRVKRKGNGVPSRGHPKVGSITDDDDNSESEDGPTSERERSSPNGVVDMEEDGELNRSDDAGEEEEGAL